MYMVNTSRPAICALYRKYLREVKRLPHSYLRQFFRLQGGDQFRAVLQTQRDDLRHKKLKRVSKGLRRLQLANAQDRSAFNRVLDIAYGRAGKLRWELMEPILSDPTATPTPPIIRGKESSRLPVCSPELTALLTSGTSRRTKPLDARELHFPPTLPDHANLKSDVALALGRLGKRREVNIRWRYFTREWKKVYPPLEISIGDREVEESQIMTSSPRSIGFQGTPLLRELLSLADIPLEPTHPTRGKLSSTCQNGSPFYGKIPPRWLRRRYRELLGRLPVLTYRITPKNPCGVYDVTLAKSAILGSSSRSTRLRTVDPEDMLWLRGTPGLEVEH